MHFVDISIKIINGIFVHFQLRFNLEIYIPVICLNCVCLSDLHICNEHPAITRVLFQGRYDFVNLLFVNEAFKIIFDL